MDGALKLCRYALVASIAAYVLSVAAAAILPAIVSTAAMVICSIGCLVLQFIRWARKRSGEASQRR
jgi:hypothetical protein